MATNSAPPTSRSTSNRIEHADDAGDGLAHGLPLAQQSGVVDPGAPADPRGDLTSAERSGDGRGSGRVADAHLAEHQQVGIELDRPRWRPARDRLVEPFGRHRRVVADVVGRPADADIDRVDRCAGHCGERGDGALARAVGGEHRGGDVGGVLAHAGAAVTP